MWSALKTAAQKIGNEVTDALDTLTEESPQGSPKEDAAPEAGAVASPEAEGAVDGKKERTAAGSGEEDRHTFQESVIDELAVASANVAQWLSTASTEVTSAVKSSVGKFNEFVEAKRHDAQDDGDDNALMRVVMAVDSLEAVTKAMEDELEALVGTSPLTQKRLLSVKESVHATWEDTQAQLAQQATALSNLLQTLTDTEMLAVTRKQSERVEHLLETGESVLTRLSKLGSEKNVFSDDSRLMAINTLEVCETKDRCTIEDAEVTLRSADNGARCTTGVVSLHASPAAAREVEPEYKEEATPESVPAVPATTQDEVESEPVSVSVPATDEAKGKCTPAPSEDTDSAFEILSSPPAGTNTAQNGKSDNPFEWDEDWQ